MIRTALAAAVTAASASVILGQSPAQAEPLADAQLNSNCIDYHEYRYELGYGQSMHEVEAITDATGRVVWSADRGQKAVAQYRWCGHTSSEGFFQVYYVLTDRGYRSRADIMYDFTCTDPTLVECGHQPDARHI